MYRAILGATLPAQAASYNAVHMTAASGSFASYSTFTSPSLPLQLDEYAES